MHLLGDNKMFYHQNIEQNNHTIDPDISTISSVATTTTTETATTTTTTTTTTNSTSADETTVTLEDENALQHQHLQQPNHQKPILKNYKLRDGTVFKLIDHAVGAIALECGYHQASQFSLDVLNDICCDYLKKIASLLALVQETQELRDDDSDFVDSLERVFHQLSIPSVANLHQFICKMDAIKKHKLRQQQQLDSVQNRQQSSEQAGPSGIPLITTPTMDTSNIVDDV